jgi:hypothetical protein
MTAKRFGLLCVTHSVLAITLAITSTNGPALAQFPDPTARIVLPIKDQTVRGGVTVHGTATSPAFIRYELAYAQEPDLANWVVIGGAVQPVDSGTLGVWNTRPLADGAYALRLQIFGTDGSVNETVVRNITLVNAAAVMPGNESTSASGVVTSTAGAAPTEIDTARDLLQVLTSTLGELPNAFVRGARLALYAFAALGAYLALKRVLGFAIKRLTRRPIDYGK